MGVRVGEGWGGDEEPCHLPNVTCPVCSKCVITCGLPFSPLSSVPLHFLRGREHRRLIAAFKMETHCAASTGTEWRPREPQRVTGSH